MKIFQPFKLIALMVTLFSVAIMTSQTRTISGTVTSADDGIPLPGVNVLVQGTTIGTQTDFDGNYSIMANTGDVLVFSYLGTQTQNLTLSTSSTLNVAMVEDASQLDEVVVTALGIKKEKKALGFAVQEIAGGELLSARENNLSNALTGKISGLQVIRGSTGPASSSKIVLRGNNSLTGSNQPLIVVDGVPMDNFTGADNNTYFNPSSDMGSGLADINPDDIASVTVLKGASAAALYGSRAGNGVILITTKTGTKSKGLGITLSSTTGFQNVFMTPDFQNDFGQGSEGVYDPESTTSWGPQITGQTVEDWQGELETLETHDNLKNFYKGGISTTHGLTFQQQISSGSSLYSSVNYLDDQGNIPGASFKRLNLSTRAVSNFGPENRWTTDVKVQYVNAKAINRPIGGENINNVHRSIISLPRTLDITDFKSPSRDQFGRMRWFLQSNSVNPFWAAEYNLNEDRRDRFLLNGSLKYQINDWISAEFKGGADLYTNNEEAKQYAGSPLSANGRYRLGKDTFIEKNYSLLVTGSKNDVLGKIGVSFTAGGNLMSQRREGLSSNAGELEVPDLFALNNGLNNATVNQVFNQKKINSVFGSVGFDYDGIFFVDFTGRNDWTSTLSRENRSFFYPSVNASFVYSELFNPTSNWFTFGKIRASYASVGNDLAPYQLYNTYNIGNDPNDNTTAGTGNTLNDPNLVNELIKSLELGMETRFFNNRLILDLAWYRSNATNQLLAIPLDPFSGFNFRRVNAGDIQNEGFEISLDASIFQNPEGFSWNTTLNYSKNENTIISLIDDVSQFQLGGFDNLRILAVAQGGYGEIWGTKFRRVEEESDPNFGKLVVDGNGLPLAAPDNETFLLGNQNPDALLGWANTFSYKNFSFGFLIDARLGGEIFSGTNRFLQRSGNSALTVVDGERNDFVVDAVVDDGTGNFVQNETAVSPQLYWTAVSNRSGNVGIGEAFIYDATNIRLRNVSINYTLNTKWLRNTGIQRAKFGISANNVWMIKSNLNGVDPESVFATGTNATGFENLSPPTVRSAFFNLSLNF